GTAGDGIDAVDGAMDGVDAGGGIVRLVGGAEREGVGEHQGALEAAPRVTLVEPGLSSTGDHEGMGRLHQEGASSAEQDGDLAVDLPGDAVGAEVAMLIHVAVNVPREPNLRPRRPRR